MSGPRFPGWVFLVYALLFALAIPWYFPRSLGERIWIGVPLWVAVSFGVTLAIAVFTVFVIRRYWPDDDTENGATS
jgi:hypothetical protein